MTADCPHWLICEPSDGRDGFCASCGHTFVGTWEAAIEQRMLWDSSSTPVSWRAWLLANERKEATAP